MSGGTSGRRSGQPPMPVRAGPRYRLPPNMEQDRRRFLKGLGVLSAAGSTPGKLVSGGAPDRSHYERGRVGNASPNLHLPHAARGRVLDAAVARLIPADDLGPGRRKRASPLFIDRQLAGALGTMARNYRQGPWPEGTPQQGFQSRLTPQEIYRAAIRETNVTASSRYEKAFEFLAAAAAGRSAARAGGGQARARLRSPATLFFGLLLGQHAWKASSPIPIYGGNRDKAGWKLVGFPGVPASNYNDSSTKHNVPYRVEPVRILDVQRRRVRARRAGPPEAREAAGTGRTANDGDQTQARRRRGRRHRHPRHPSSRKELADAGLKVVGARARAHGRHRSTISRCRTCTTSCKYDRHSDIFQDLSRETITFRNASQRDGAADARDGLVQAGRRRRRHGGALGHGMTWRFLPWDFETRSRTIERYGKGRFPTDCTSQDWGITYDELEPYYDQFEHLYGVGGKAGNLKARSSRAATRSKARARASIPNPPCNDHYAGTLFAQGVRRSLGYKPFTHPAAAHDAALHEPYRLDAGRSASTAASASASAARMGAKASPLTTVMPALLKHAELRAAPALRTSSSVNLDSDGKRAVGVTYLDARGREFEQPADLVMLPPTSFNNVRLHAALRASASPTTRSPNAGVVGRNYAYQSAGRVTLFFEDKAFNPFMGGGARGTVDRRIQRRQLRPCGARLLRRRLHLGRQQRRRAPIELHPCRRARRTGARTGSRPWRSTTTATSASRCHGGCQSYRAELPRSRSDLPRRQRPAAPAHDLRLARERAQDVGAASTKKADEIAKAIGPSKMSVAPHAGNTASCPTRARTTSAARSMGADPRRARSTSTRSRGTCRTSSWSAAARSRRTAAQPHRNRRRATCWALDAIKDRYLAARGRSLIPTEAPAPRCRLDG